MIISLYVFFSIFEDTITYAFTKFEKNITIKSKYTEYFPNYGRTGRYEYMIIDNKNNIYLIKNAQYVI